MQTDYIGKDVYVGIDVHKKSYSIYCICNREKIKSWSMEASPAKLIEQLLFHFAYSDENEHPFWSNVNTCYFNALSQ